MFTNTKEFHSFFHLLATYGRTHTQPSNHFQFQSCNSTYTQVCKVAYEETRCLRNREDLTTTLLTIRFSSSFFPSLELVVTTLNKQTGEVYDAQERKVVTRMDVRVVLLMLMDVAYVCL
ncbi:hypothetical protein HanIR_Chr02g0052361 [Helianthus annuus]|nr:hypothetical protein HanIR_Chr02g0052361 [Helianthus annuus]